MISTRSLGARLWQSIRLNHCNSRAPAEVNPSVKVNVKQGTIIGGEQTLPNGNSYTYFKGIPYAVPPLGELRFQAPVPLESFAVPELDCTMEGDVCYQKDTTTRDIIGSENCLYLNVYAPRSKTQTPMPVMVFIHGGRYTFGSGNSDSFTPLYLMQEDVVVVTLNYRLGALGFLALPEANIPGNAALKDQRLALQWVKENIAKFNGDADNVTLFGESAGAACVHFHVLSENSKKLFHKAIMQSGTANMPWSVGHNPTDTYTKLAKLMGCTSEEPFAVAQFLKTHPKLSDFLTLLLRVQTPEERRRGLPIVSKPVIERDSPDAIITEEPLCAMKRQNSIDIPIIMGYNSAEGITMLAAVRKYLEAFDKDLTRLIPVNVNLHPEDPKSMELANMIRELYFKGAKIDENKLNNFVDLQGDFHFIMDCWAAAEFHSRKQHKSPLFFYRFDYVGELNIYKKLFKMDELKGACHGDDLFYIFQAKEAPEPWEERDKQMVKTMCKLWANFAKHGNPTPKEAGSFVDCTWEPVRKIGDGDKFNLNAFIIDERQRMMENPNKDRSEFWRDVYQRYNGSVSSKL